MRVLARLAFAAAAVGAGLGPAVAGELPKVDGRPAVASVNGEPIFLDDLEREIAAVHAGHGEGARSARRPDPSALLERVITARLFAQEARNIGFADLEESRAQIERIRLEALRDRIVERALRDAGAPDPRQVEAIFHQAVGEYRVRSVLIPAESDARDLEAKLKAGGRFGDLATRLVESGKGREGDAGEWLRSADLQPEVAISLARMKAGDVSGIFKAGKAWTVYELLESRFPEDPAARARAREVAEEETRRAALASYMERLRSSCATVDREVLDALDYEAPGALAALRTDSRAVARIRGEKPVTVADLTAGIEQRFFHGIEKAVDSKKVNREKGKVLEDVLNRRVVASEARKLRLDSTGEYTAAVARAETALLFETFLRKVVVPEVRIAEGDLEAYHTAHAQEFMGPERIAVEAIAFSNREDAEAALSKLKRGAGFAWMKANAKGQVAPGAPRLLELPSGRVAVDSFPEEIRDALEGAGEGEHRLVGGKDGRFYVLRLEERSAAAVLPLDAVRETVRKAVHQEKLSKLVSEWDAKLRKASDVRVHATGEDLNRLVLRDLSPEN